MFRKQSNKKNEFECLYNTYYEKLYYFSYSILRDENDSQDVIADAFVSVWAKWDDLNNTDNIVGYLYTAVRNNCIKLRQHKNSSLDILEDAGVTLLVDENSPELKLLSQEALGIINKSINELPARCKMIFLMAKEQNMSYKEISLLLNISVKTVQAQMVIALGRIRNTLLKFNIQ